MDEPNVAVNAAGSSQGIETSPGSAAPESGTPSPVANSQASPATPSESAPVQSGTPKRLFNDLDSAERDYKALQARATKAEQAIAKFGDLTAAEQRLALLGQLQQDPKFREWAQARLAEQETGSGDAETVKALEIVKSVAQREAQQLMAPMAAQLQGARLAAVLQAMDRKHPDWREHQEQIRDGLVSGIQAGMFPPTAIHNISLDFLEKLYAMTVGLDDERAAKAYAKKLAAKQAASTTSTPGTAPAATANPTVKTIHEALALARKKAG